MPELKIGQRRFRLPASRIARIALGCLFVVMGLFGFLPILGFWMVPVGLLILSHDIPVVRRQRRRFAVWWMRRSMRPKTA
jgi:purine-cytosine permease-like protein